MGADAWAHEKGGKGEKGKTGKENEKGKGGKGEGNLPKGKGKKGSADSSVPIAQVAQDGTEDNGFAMQQFSPLSEQAIGSLVLDGIDQKALWDFKPRNRYRNLGPSEADWINEIHRVFSQSNLAFRIGSFWPNPTAIDEEMFTYQGVPTQYPSHPHPPVYIYDRYHEGTNRMDTFAQFSVNKQRYVQM